MQSGAAELVGLRRWNEDTIDEVARFIHMKDGICDNCMRAWTWRSEAFLLL